MNLRDLDYIRAVARHAHFGRAAESCRISQPALSTQIKKLENELGVILFERDNRSVTLTDIGTRIVALAEEALAVVDTIRATADNARDPLSGELSIGSIPTIAPYLIPHVVQIASTRLPRLKLKFREDITERLNRALLDNSLDAAILATPPEDKRLTATELYDEPFWVVYPDEHLLADKTSIEIDDLPPDELLLLAEGHCFRDQALELLKRPRQPESDAISATSLETLINMVVAGQGITLAPAMALTGSWTTDKRISTQRLADSCASRRVYLTHRKSFPRQQLLDVLTSELLDTPPSGECLNLERCS